MTLIIAASQRRFKGFAKRWGSRLTGCFTLARPDRIHGWSHETIVIALDGWDNHEDTREAYFVCRARLMRVLSEAEFLGGLLETMSTPAPQPIRKRTIASMPRKLAPPQRAALRARAGKGAGLQSVSRAGAVAAIRHGRDRRGGDGEGYLRGARPQLSGTNRPGGTAQMTLHRSFVGKDCLHEFEYAHLWPLRPCWSIGLVGRYPTWCFGIVGLHLWYYGPAGAWLFGIYWRKS